MAEQARKSETIVLPWPPSMNRHWRSVPIRGGCRVLISREGRAYRKVVKARMPRSSRFPLLGRVSCSIALFAPNRRKHDIDNRLKPLIDALQQAGVIGDDEQIDDLHIWRAGVDKSGGYVEVTLSELKGDT